MTFVVVAKWTAKPGEEAAVEAAIRRLIEPSRAEPANLFYQTHTDPENPRVFYFYEQYVDEDGYKAHGESSHFKEIGFGDVQIGRASCRERVYGPV